MLARPLEAPPAPALSRSRTHCASSYARRSQALARVRVRLRAAAEACAVQVDVSLLGVLGRSGWYCLESDLNRWPGLAGWRGLHDAAVSTYFGQTLFAPNRSGGMHEDLITKALGLDYQTQYLDATEYEGVITDRLSLGLPTLFYLWSPHPLLAKSRPQALSRIQLPEYSPLKSDMGKVDYPTEVLVKLASKWLDERAPLVKQLYSRFSLDNSAQEAMMAAVESEALSVFQAVCTWMTDAEHTEMWSLWFPPERLVCAVGGYIADVAGATPHCEECPPGHVSRGGTVSACVACAPGTLVPSDPPSDCGRPSVGRQHARGACLVQATSRATRAKGAA